MDSCIFCKIIANQLPSSRLHQDDRCTAFLDIRPVNPGHLLVIPNKHAASLSELDPEDGAHMFRIAQRMAGALRGGAVRCEGVNLHLADGSAAGQEVFHVHLHVFPRFSGDAFRITLGGSLKNSPTKTELDSIAERIRAGL
jgi:histidine triad (HIT) family protein